MKRDWLVQDVLEVTERLALSKQALLAFDCAPENNVFDSLEIAEYSLFDKLEGFAQADCEGSHSCGSPEYCQEFIVGGVHYLATLAVEYNRHDKTYYYIDSSEFTIKELEA